MSAKTIYKIPRLSAGQFDAIVAIGRLKPGSAACKAARLVVVDGLSIGEARAAVGITYNAAHQGVMRIKAAHELVKNVAAD